MFIFVMICTRTNDNDVNWRMKDSEKETAEKFDLTFNIYKGQQM